MGTVKVKLNSGKEFELDAGDARELYAVLRDLLVPAAMVPSCWEILPAKEKKSSAWERYYYYPTVWMDK